MRQRPWTNARTWLAKAAPGTDDVAAALAVVDHVVVADDDGVVAVELAHVEVVCNHKAVAQRDNNLGVDVAVAVARDLCVHCVLHAGVAAYCETCTDTDWPG